MRVTLAKEIGVVEPELPISGNQTRLAVERLEHQLSHKPFGLQFVLPTRCAGVRVVWKL